MRHTKTFKEVRPMKFTAFVEGLMDKYGLEPGKIIFSKFGFVWFATDHEKIVELEDEDAKVLEEFGSETVIVDTDDLNLAIRVELSVEEKPLLMAARAFKMFSCN